MWFYITFWLIWQNKLCSYAAFYCKLHAFWTCFYDSSSAITECKIYIVGSCFNIVTLLCNMATTSSTAWSASMWIIAFTNLSLFLHTPATMWKFCHVTPVHMLMQFSTVELATNVDKKDTNHCNLICLCSFSNY